MSNSNEGVTENEGGLQEKIELPKLVQPPARELAGPTPWCNWVIKGHLLAGAYPASIDDRETDRILTRLLETGVNTFVCMQAEVNLNISETSWRSGQGLRPYIRDVHRLLSRASESPNSKMSQKKIDFLHLPIVDGSVTTDSSIQHLAEDVRDRMLRGEMLYIHCWGGHGRTGTLIAILLGMLYNISTNEALNLTQIYHDTRVYPQGVRSPQTAVQRAQVRRILLTCRWMCGNRSPRSAKLNNTMTNNSIISGSSNISSQRAKTAHSTSIIEQNRGSGLNGGLQRQLSVNRMGGQKGGLGREPLTPPEYSGGSSNNRILHTSLSNFSRYDSSVDRLTAQFSSLREKGGAAKQTKSSSLKKNWVF